jgi:hypothetical protein
MLIVDPTIRLSRESSGALAERFQTSGSAVGRDAQRLRAITTDDVQPAGESEPRLFRRRGLRPMTDALSRRCDGSATRGAGIAGLRSWELEAYTARSGG